MTASNPKLSSLQLELLKTFSFEPTEEELMAVRNFLAGYFAHRFTKQIAEAAEIKGIKDADLEKWLESDDQ